MAMGMSPRRVGKRGPAGLEVGREKGGGKNMRKVLSKVGQSTLEYVIVLTAIVAAILFAATQFIKPGVNRIYDETGTKLNDTATVFANKIGISLNTTGAAAGAAASGASGSGV